MGDGEQQEGNIWEAAMEGSHYKLDNLVGIIDRNRLQIDGWVKDVMNVEPLEERYRSFGWEVIDIDGHDMTQVVDALQKAKNIPAPASRRSSSPTPSRARASASWRTSPAGTARPQATTRW